MRLAEFFGDHGGGHDEQISAAGVSGGWFFVFLFGCGFALPVSFLDKILQALGADGDDEVSFINASAQPIHLTLLTDLQMLPEIQRYLQTNIQTHNKYRVTLGTMCLEFRFMCFEVKYRQNTLKHIGKMHYKSSLNVLIRPCNVS